MSEEEIPQFEVGELPFCEVDSLVFLFFSILFQSVSEAGEKIAADVNYHTDMVESAYHCF